VQSIFTFVKITEIICKIICTTQVERIHDEE
jgi:hypothetical protein